MRRLLCIALLLAACSKEEPASLGSSSGSSVPLGAPTPPPSIAEVRELIASSAEFGDYQFTDASYTLPVSGSAMNEPARAMARTLANAGWLAIDGAGDVMLTEKSRTDKRFLLRENGILDIVPLAKKEMGTVSAVRANPDNTAAADFTWTWIPNEVGALMPDKFAGTRNARASLIWDGTGWGVWRIE